MRKVALLSVMAVAAIVAHAQKVSPDVNVQIQPAIGGNFCLDAAQNSARDGSQVHVYQCHGVVNQRWTITTSSNDKEHAIVGIGGYCLDVPSTGTPLGTPIQIAKCHFGPSQRFTITPDGHILEPATAGE
jgi:hypothetical protein